MKYSITTAKRIVVGAVVVGALSLGSAGMAGAATTADSTTASTAAPSVGKNFDCANATKVLDRIQSGEAKIAAGLPKLTAREAKLTAAGRTKVAARLQRRITRLESSTFKARLDKASTVIETKCNVTAPAAQS
jgi:hypothetical protein